MRSPLPTHSTLTTTTALRTRTALPTRIFGAAAVLVLAAACGSPGSSGGGGATTVSNAPSTDLAVCEAVPGDDIVVLEDDQNLQNPDNIIPAANADFATSNPAVLSVLEPLVGVLDTEALIELNRAVDVDRQSSAQAAKAFVTENGLDETDQVGAGATVVIGSPGFSEGATLAAVYAQMLNAAGFKAVTQDVGNRELYLPDLESGDVSIVPEYVSTLTEFLNVRANGDQGEPAASPDLDATVSALTDLAAEAGIAVGTPAPAQDQNVYAVTTGFAEENNLTTLTDLAQNCGGVVLGGPPECPERSFCQLGLERVYGIDFGSFTSLDPGGPLTKEALRKGEITLGMIFSSDAELAN